ncbi:hypothetical protein COY16_02200 [Candidatus Roizmanbacteria bacterium CG_4_10_14_0_2_um_filter_39_13]|uniref:Glycosidase n=1 Tax=Candidatus Roizmanbacteria bacterium CG_4_10_14_0_2_um_filter_39_13 TaxID=1974825 RepID=A0A2M7TZU1_9BACT|nr:MAG: hypothetical protein COY16_02200 [Candidatus Roizmanbacteria bacterium CG_4_10_14_0_2_um_filter_39_13]
MSLESIRVKLSSYFRSNEVDSDHIPLRIFMKNNQVIFLYKSKKNNHVIKAESEDGFNFEITPGTNEHLLPLPNEFQVPHLLYKEQQVKYYGDRNIKVSYSIKGEDWKSNVKTLILAAFPIEVAQVILRTQGILVQYFGKEIRDNRMHYSMYLALFNKDQPDQLLWKTNEPIWHQDTEWSEKDIRPIGSIFLEDKIISYWFVDGKCIYGIVHSGFLYDPKKILENSIIKHSDNPIIAPKKKNDWEAFNTFNPAVLQTGNKVHILYRAQGFDYISTVGYASSNDGITINDRLDKPIFSPSNDFETNDSSGVNHDFVSGGGFGGCEDPRLTQIDNRVYMTYVAFDGWSPPRLALTSIHIEDFLRKRWHWSKPVLVSPPGIVDKSGCLLSEKINGKYVFFHRVFPNILIDFLDDLNFDGKTKFLKGEHQIKVRPNKWDSRKIGAGAPPIKTEHGWLLIYYGVDDRDDSKYLIGAMLLDLKDPTKVLYRSDDPIMRPDEVYENNGFKPGIIYPCGAAVIAENLMIYYGGADSYVCVACANLNTFLQELMTQKPVHLKSLEVRELSYG